jgi:hypothetical protein
MDYKINYDFPLEITYKLKIDLVVKIVYFDTTVTIFSPSF